MIVVLAVAAASAQAGNVSGDFNGDGRSDLAVSVEGQTVGGQAFAGAVQVMYGSRHGLSGTRDRVFTQDTPGVKETAEPGDELATPSRAATSTATAGRISLSGRRSRTKARSPTRAWCRSSMAPSTASE